VICRRSAGNDARFNQHACQPKLLHPHLRRHDLDPRGTEDPQRRRAELTYTTNTDGEGGSSARCRPDAAHDLSLSKSFYLHGFDFVAEIDEGRVLSDRLRAHGHRRAVSDFNQPDLLER